jgi:hypothetical protein
MKKQKYSPSFIIQIKENTKNIHLLLSFKLKKKQKNILYLSSFIIQIKENTKNIHLLLSFKLKKKQKYSLSFIIHIKENTKIFTFFYHSN